MIPEEREAILRRLEEIIPYRGIAQFGRDCDIDEATIRYWLKERVLPDVEDLITICKRKGQSIIWLLWGRQPEPWEDERMLSIIHELQKLTPQELDFARAAIMGVITGIIVSRQKGEEPREGLTAQRPS